MNDQQFRVLSPTGVPMSGVAYSVKTASGAHVASTAAEGKSALINTEKPDTVAFDLHFDEFAPASGRPFIPASAEA
jgi:type VI secretion system secreted protein VgrG